MLQTSSPLATLINRESKLHTAFLCIYTAPTDLAAFNNYKVVKLTKLEQKAQLCPTTYHFFWNGTHSYKNLDLLLIISILVTVKDSFQSPELQLF